MAPALKPLLRSAYFAALPWCNYLLNLYWHHRFTRRYIPKAIYLEGTNLCNARCVMCPHEKLTRPRGHMPWELFTKIIDECAGFEGRGLQVFLHKDGEPLMDPRLFDRIRYAKARLPRSRVHFNTNAALLTPEKTELLLATPLDSLVFSVDGASPETYGRIRVGLDYATVTANVRHFLERKRAVGSRLRAGLQMVVSRDNAHEIPLYRQQWAGLADRVVFKPMHNFLVQGTALHGGELGAVQRRRCTMPFHVMLFYVSGDVALCCWDYDALRPLGNIREASVLDVYNNERFSAVRRAMRAMDCGALAPCNRCSQIYGDDGPMGSAGHRFDDAGRSAPTPPAEETADAGTP